VAGTLVERTSRYVMLLHLPDGRGGIWLVRRCGRRSPRCRVSWDRLQDRLPMASRERRPPAGASRRGEPLRPPSVSLLERQWIATLRRQGFGVRAIARELARAPSTVSRELHRNPDQPIPAAAIYPTRLPIPRGRTAEVVSDALLLVPAEIPALPHPASVT
jgi:helix-turn-helix protein